MGILLDLDIGAYPGNILNNEFVSTSTTRHTVNPANGENLYEVPVATRDDLDNAVRYARAAFKSWSRTTWDSRGELLLKYAEAIEKHRDMLERLDVLESGKPASLAKIEYDMSLAWLRAFATMELKDEILEEDEDHVVYSTRPPLGVCAAIAPWNWPVLLSLGKVGPALMTGNCIIVKPSPYTPYSSLKLGELAMSIFPAGVVQVLSGTNNLGPWITDHPDIDMVAFTGSIRTGKLVAASCAKMLKRYILELGGNDAAVVCEDVDPNDPACLHKITQLAFLNSGQICMDVKRIYVHDKIYDQFRDAMVKFTRENIKTGDPFEKDTVVGPLQNKDQFNLVRGMYDWVRQADLKVALDGEVRQTAKGFYVEPVIIDNPPEDSRVVVEEPFGPIVPLLRWSDEDDVIDRVNAFETGLGASVWSRDLDRAERMARQLSAGSVWVNSHFDTSPWVPFGGHKQSGVGVEWGIEGFRHYTNSRSLWVWKRVLGRG